MAQFNVENSQSPPSGPGLTHHWPEALRQVAPVGPRLVGGTTFAGKSALDMAQIQILAQACLQGLDAARQVVFGWQRQGSHWKTFTFKASRPAPVCWASGGAPTGSISP